jgi:nicotinate phosphoribosyltransferase
MKPSTLYRPTLALLTDFYELTMAQAYYAKGMAEIPAVFNLFFRKPPFGSGYTLVAGLEAVVDFIEHFRFDAEDIEFLRAQRDDAGLPLFTEDFLAYLAGLKLTLDLDALPEGTIAFPQEPLIRVRGPLAQAQIIETALLNMVNFSSLVATKAAQVVAAAQGPVLEFGLRRAQGIDGGLTASWSAYLGGCVATSNTLAGRLFGIPVKGTHAHSWVLSFADERDAFDAYAQAMPNNSTLLVDTYNTLDGVRHAIETGHKLRAAGHTLSGIRLDSGDLAYLSIEARKLLDAAGFPETKIVASNDLDPQTISALHVEGARIDIWGVGTKLVTCYDQPALGGVYKLVAIADDPAEPDNWRTPIKISEDSIKITIPGMLGVRRFYDPTGTARADMIYDERKPGDAKNIIDPTTDFHQHEVEADWTSRELLTPIFRGGHLVYELPSLQEIRTYAAGELKTLHETVRRLLNPHHYPAGLEEGLYRRRVAMIMEQRGLNNKQEF